MKLFIDTVFGSGKHKGQFVGKQAIEAMFAALNFLFNNGKQGVPRVIPDIESISCSWSGGPWAPDLHMTIKAIASKHGQNTLVILEIHHTEEFLPVSGCPTKESISNHVIEKVSEALRTYREHEALVGSKS